MKQSKPSFSHMIKTAVCVVALVNLAVLFLFQYELPSFFTSKAKETEDSAAVESESDTTETEPEPTAAETAYTFAFDPDPLTVCPQKIYVNWPICITGMAFIPAITAITMVP